MGSSRGLLQFAWAGGLLSCAHVSHLIALATSTSRTAKVVLADILSSLWSVAISACEDSTVLITWQPKLGKGES